MDTVVKSVSDIGAAVRRRRLEDRLTIAQAADLCNVNYRFLSELENGKQTVRFDKVIQVPAGVGLELKIKEKSWPDE